MGRQINEATASSIHTGDGEGVPEGLVEQLLVHQQNDNARIVFLHGEVTENAIASCIAQLLALANMGSKPIHLVISTYGGSIDEMFGLYDTIKFLPCPVHTVALGKVMSAGVVLLAAGAKGKRMIGATSRIMMHSVSGGMFGNVFEMENHTKEQRRLHDLMVDVLAKETKMSHAKVAQIMDPKLDYYITSREALQLGIADKIIGIPK
jgi:ATP-dependent Clp protease protease subunit